MIDFFIPWKAVFYSGGRETERMNANLFGFTTDITSSYGICLQSVTEKEIAWSPIAYLLIQSIK